MYGTPTVEVRKNGPLEQLLAKVHPAHKLAKRPSISYLSLYIRRITACHQKFQDMIRDSSFLVLLLVAGAACLETGVDISSSNGGEIEQLRRPNNRGDMHRRLGKKGSSSDEEETTVPTTSPMPTPAPSTSEPTLLTEQEKDSSSGKKSSSKSGKKSSSKSGKKSSKSGKKGSDEERATEPPTLAPTTEQPSLYPTATAYPTISEYPTISNPPSLMPTMDDFDTTLDLDSVGAQYQPAFENAAARWDTIIVGDVPDITVDQAERDDTMCDKLPDEIDDIYICAKIAPNDGPGMILGYVVL